LMLVSCANLAIDGLDFPIKSAYTKKALWSLLTTMQTP
jgi:hypothetical protein